MSLRENSNNDLKKHEKNYKRVVKYFLKCTRKVFNTITPKLSERQRRGRQVVLLLRPILHSVVFPCRRFSVKFCYIAINSSFHEQPQEDGRPQKRESYEPYCIIVYSVAIRPFSTLKFKLGSKVWGNETKKIISGLSNE